MCLAFISVLEKNLETLSKGWDSTVVKPWWQKLGIYSAVLESRSNGYIRWNWAFITDVT